MKVFLLNFQHCFFPSPVHFFLLLYAISLHSLLLSLFLFRQMSGEGDVGAVLDSNVSVQSSIQSSTQSSRSVQQQSTMSSNVVAGSDTSSMDELSLSVFSFFLALTARQQACNRSFFSACLPRLCYIH